MKVGTPFPRLLAAMLIAAGLSALEGQRANADDLATIRQRGTLVVGVKADYRPFGFRSPSGEIVGIEPALAADVAQSLGVKLELVPVAASNRIQLLEEGKIDLIIATMNGTMDRRWAVEIVKPNYYAAGYNVMLPRSMNLKSWAELKGKPVCGIEGAYYNYEAATNFELQVIPFAGTAEALKALQQGSCVGLLFDDTAIEGTHAGAGVDQLRHAARIPGGAALGGCGAQGPAGMGRLPVRQGHQMGEGRHDPGPRDEIPNQAFEVRRGRAPQGVRVFRQLARLLAARTCGPATICRSLGRLVVRLGWTRIGAWCAMAARPIRRRKPWHRHPRLNRATASGARFPS